MEIKVDSKYNPIAQLMRYASILSNYKKSKNLSPFGEKLVSISNSLKFYAFPYCFLNQKNSIEITKAVEPHLKEQNREKNILDMNSRDSHFIDSIGVSDIDKNIEQIFNSCTNFYNSGNFEKLNRACYRFLKKIKGANEMDMNDAVIRYMISSICLADFSHCYSIIETLSNEYGLYDYNIYLFMLYFSESRYQDAAKYMFRIKSGNISEDIYDYIKEDDLAFYFAFCLLFNFEASFYKEVLSNNDLYVYKLYDKYPDFFSIVDKYYKCDYLNVCNEFNTKVKERIKKDPFLCGFADEIDRKFKKKVLMEILSFSSKISFQTISELLVLGNKNSVIDLISDLIRVEHINAIIDDIDEVVIMKEENPMNYILNKSNELLERNLDELITFSYKNIKSKITGKVDGKNIEKKSMNMVDMIERQQLMMLEYGGF